MAKKKTKKKTTKKKTRTKKAPETSGVKIEITVLKKVPSKKTFMLSDGRTLRDLRDLAFALSDMADHVFWHHVNDAKNDFAHWIEDSVKDKELANALRKANDKFNAQLTVLRHIVKKL